MNILFEVMPLIAICVTIWGMWRLKRGVEAVWNYIEAVETHAVGKTKLISVEAGKATQRSYEAIELGRDAFKLTRMLTEKHNALVSRIKDRCLVDDKPKDRDLKDTEENIA